MQRAAARIELDYLAAEAFEFEDYEGGSQRCMPAQVHLDLRSEPSDFESISCLDEECGFRQVVFHCNLLHQLVRQPGLQRADGRRVSAKKPVCKCINLKNPEFHGSRLFLIVAGAVGKERQCARFLHSKPGAAKPPFETPYPLPVSFNWGGNKMGRMLSFFQTRRVKRVNRLKKWERLFFIVGLVALGTYGGARLYSAAYQSYTMYSFDQQLNGRSPSVFGFLAHVMALKRPANSANSTKTVDGGRLLRDMVYAPEIVPEGKGWSADRLRDFKRAPSPATGSVLGRLEIPSLDLSVMLVQGTDAWTLNRAVGHIEGTALPGRNGNIGIAGHRDGFFRPLKDIKRNDTITLTTLYGRFTYRVDAIKIVKPEDVKVLSPTAAPTLTLVTCYPFYYVGDAPNRYVVTAELVKSETPSEVAAQYANNSR
jgi:LPXTG-site transpeptidase (sortase) family protein